MQLRLNKRDSALAVHFPAQKRTVLENISPDFSEAPVDGEPAILQMPDFAFIFDIALSRGKIIFDETDSLTVLGYDNNGYFRLGLGACIGHHTYSFEIDKITDMISNAIDKFWFTRFYREPGSSRPTTLTIEKAIQIKSRCGFQLSSVDGRSICLYAYCFDPVTIDELMCYLKEIK